MNMKRSEKVEIRVTLEEKETLNSLAQYEGVSVSELVRNLVQKFVALNSQPKARPLPRRMIAGLVAGGFAGAAVLFWALGFSRGVPSSNQYALHGHIEDHAFGLTIRTDQKEPAKLLLGETYILTAQPIEPALIKVSVCARNEETCKTVAQMDFSVLPRHPVVWQTRGLEEDVIYLFLQKLAPDEA